MNIIDVSVLVTCFNKEPYLDECISSVVRQTKQPKEIIIVHDECKEPMHHAEATTIMLKTNMGVARARHEAFRFSTGKLILFLDGDDLIAPDYLEKMTMQIFGGADISFPDMYLFEGGEPELVETIPLTPKYIQEMRKVPLPVTCLMKREVYESLGGFRDLTTMEDMDFWLRAMCNHYTFRKAQTLLWYRQHVQSRNHDIDLLKKRKLMDEILNQFIISDTSIKRRKNNG